MCTDKLQFALSIRHWTCPSCLVRAERQNRRLVPRQYKVAGSGKARDLRQGGAGKRASTAELSGDRVPKTAYPAPSVYTGTANPGGGR
jgi:hypothetical protein